jgi:hypothetical protein
MVDEFWTRKANDPIMRDQGVETNRFLQLDPWMVDRLRINAFDDDVQPEVNREDDDHYRLVPFTWNFGLCLLRKKIWMDAWKEMSGKSYGTTDHKVIKGVVEFVNGKLEDLGEFGSSENRAADAFSYMRRNRTRSSRSRTLFWHDFLAASEFVAGEHNKARIGSEEISVFELDMPDTQSLACFVLEVWLSTYVWFSARGLVSNAVMAERAEACLNLFRKVKKNERAPQAEKPVAERAPEMSLIGTICLGLNYIEGMVGNRDIGSKQEHVPSADAKSVMCGELVFCLYLTLKMLGQVIKFDEWQFDRDTFVFKPKRGHGNAAAGRFWYSSASALLRSKTEGGEDVFEPENPIVPLALPGSFSNRGDWQLAVLASSRSRYLGELAIAELSRLNEALIRLKSGVGLPMLRLADDPGNEEVYGNIRTALPSPYGGKLGTFDYAYVRAISPLMRKKNRPFPGHHGLYPIFRSDITEYMEEHTLLRQALCRMLVRFSEFNGIRIKQSGSTDRVDEGVGFFEMMLSIEGETLENALCMELGALRNSRKKGASSSRGVIQDFETWKIFASYMKTLGPLKNVLSNADEM